MNLLTSSEVAKRFGVTPAAVREWERKGLLPATKTETGVRIFREEDVKKFAQQRAQKTS